VEGAEFHRQGGVGDVDDAQAGVAGHVGEVAHHLDVPCVRRVESAELHREGGDGDVDDAQAGVAADHVGEVAHHFDIPGPARAWRIESPDLDRGRRIRDVDDAQAGAAIGHVGEVADDLDVVRVARREEVTYRDERTGSRANGDRDTHAKNSKQTPHLRPLQFRSAYLLTQSAVNHFQDAAVCPASAKVNAVPKASVSAEKLRPKRLDGKLADETVRREVSAIAEEFPEVEGGLLERETGFEPATLSLGM